MNKVSGFNYVCWNIVKLIPQHEHECIIAFHYITGKEAKFIN